MASSAHRIRSSPVLATVLATALLAVAPRTAGAPALKGVFEPVPYPEDVQLLDVFFINEREGWVAGGTTVMNGGILLHTSDGGDHWDVQLGDSKSSDRGPLSGVPLIGAPSAKGIRSSSSI